MNIIKHVIYQYIIDYINNILTCNNVLNIYIQYLYIQFCIDLNHKICYICIDKNNNKINRGER